MKIPKASVPHTAGINSKNIRLFCEEGKDYEHYQSRGIDPARLSMAVNFLKVI